MPPIQGCPDYATKEELQELRDQLNEVLGKQEGGGAQKIFEAGAPIAGGLVQAGATAWLGTKLQALNALQDLTLEGATGRTLLEDFATGRAKYLGTKGNGAKYSVTSLNKLLETSGSNGLASNVNAKAAKVNGGGLAVLANLVTIGATLALNIATVNVLDSRIEAEASGVRFQLDAMNNTMLRLYSKNQGDITKVRAEIDDTNQRLEANRDLITATQASVQQANDERRRLDDLIGKANTNIVNLKADNAELRQQLADSNINQSEFKTEVEQYINDNDSRLAEAEGIIIEQKSTIDKLIERIEVLEFNLKELAWAYGRLDADLVLLRFEFDKLRADLEGDLDLTNDRVSLIEGKIVKVQKFVKLNQGGSSSSAGLQGAATGQQGILELANNLAGNPITVPPITNAGVANGSQTFKDTLAGLLPQIDSANMNQTQLDNLQKSINSDFKAELTAIGLVGLTDNLLDLRNQTKFDRIAKATEKGICNSLNGGGCSNTPGQPPGIQGLGGLGKALSGKMDAINASLNGTAIAQNTQILSVVRDTNGVVRSPDFGLQKIQEFAGTAWKATHADKAMNMISTVLALHNGMMLSNNLGATIGEAASLGLEAIGVTDTAGNPFDINTLVRGKVNSILANILGQEQYLALTAKLAKANRIYQASINVLDTTRNLFDSANTIAEIGIEYTGQIGNALREAGVVAEDAYDEMLEKVNPQSAAMRKIQKFKSGVDNIEEVVSTVSQVSGEVVEIKDNLEQLRREKENLDEEIAIAKEEKIAERIEIKEASRVQTDITLGDFDPAPTNDT